MAALLGALTAAWIAGLLAGIASILPVASVARLLPRRWARLEAVLWLAVPAAQLLAAAATLIAARAWAHNLIAYTPHLERPLPHLCFIHASRTLLGAEFFRAGSVLATAAFILAAARLVAGLATSQRRLRALLENARAMANPFHERLFITGQNSPPATIGLLRPVVVMGEDAAALDMDALGAILAHEAAHATWRDPLTGVIIEALAWLWPLPGLIVARAWRRASEAAADNSALRRAGARAWAAARGLYSDAALQTDPESRRPSSPAPAAAAAVAWLLLFIALVHILWRPTVLSLVCAFEAFAGAWH